MSRRRGEFEHRTSIFEGAFRAWSHLGGLEPEDLESRPVSEVDPLTNPIDDDPRLTGKKVLKQENTLNPNGTPRRQYPYEPLPRSGLSHPFVQAILSPWLGPDADNDAIQLGLTTLRTWWQHRRKGESGSAIAALGTEKMKGVVEGYTRHFFTLAHCLIVNDKEQPPRSLHTKMKELEKMRSKRNKKRNRDDIPGDGLTSIPGMGGGMGMPGEDPMAASIAADLQNNSLSPLERLHMAQQNQLAAVGGLQEFNDLAGMGQPIMPIINIKNKCVPGKPDLPAIVDAVNHAANQLAHSGGTRGNQPSAVPSSVLSGSAAVNYGDPDSIPIVFVSENGDAIIAMSVDGITCAHCVKIVETVLRGCNGNKSPIDGLLDAAADRALCAVLIRVDRVSNSKRIAFEAARNLAMVGYTAKAKVMSPTVEVDGKPTRMSLDDMYKAFQAVGLADPKDLFDWSAPCSCPDNGVARDDCAR
jgi:copper chaperone CopZ